MIALNILIICMYFRDLKPENILIDHEGFVKVCKVIIVIFPFKLCYKL